MLERLFDFILNFISLFIFWVVIDDFEEGVVLRLGRFNRELKPGFHWIMPFGFESVFTDNVVPTTNNLGACTLTCSCGTNIVIAAIVTWKIRDIRKVLLEVEGADQAMVDSTYGAIADAVMSKSWAEIVTPEFPEYLTSVVRKQCFRWGIEVMKVSLSDLGKVKSIRLVE